ncbi:MAG: DinB family protein [Gammaproteobacteria bacterium]
MIRHQFRTLAAYNRQMNVQFYSACARLDDADLRKDRGAFFSSIFGTLNHMLLVDRLWFGGFTGNRVEFGSLREELFADFQELRTEREKTDADIVAWVETLTDDALAAPFSEQLAFPLWLTVTHFFNHQTHHRGQVSALLSQCGIDYGTTDLPWVDGIGPPLNPGG